MIEVTWRLPSTAMDLLMESLSGAHYSGWRPSTTSSSSLRLPAVPGDPNAPSQPFVIGKLIQSLNSSISFFDVLVFMIYSSIGRCRSRAFGFPGK